MATKLLDKLQKAGSLGNISEKFSQSDFPGPTTANRGSSSSQRIVKWGPQPQDAAKGANAPAAASLAPEDPAEFLASHWDTSSLTEEQKACLASLKSKAAEPSTTAAASLSSGRPKATVQIAPFSDSFCMATKKLDLAKRDCDQATKRVNDALVEIQEAREDLELTELAVVSATEARQKAWDEFQSVNKNLGVKPTPILQPVADASTFVQVSTFCETFASLNPLAADICAEMHASILKFSKMCADFEKAAAAKAAAEGVSSPAVQAPGGSIIPVPEASISAENEDVVLSDGGFSDGSGVGGGRKNLLAASAAITIGSGGEDSEDNRRQLKIQCTDAEKSAKNALAATGAAATNATSSSG